MHPRTRTTWKPVLCAISTYGKGRARGTTATNNRYYDRDYAAEKRRNKQFLQQLKNNVKEKKKAEVVLSDHTSPSALVKCPHLLNGHCIYGNKCKFSHAPFKPYTDGPYVEAKVYFKSLDLDDLDKNQLWKLAEQFGEVKNIVFNNINDPRMVAGSIFMTNERAAYALAEELNYKTFINDKRRADQRKRYTRAEVQGVFNAVRTASIECIDKKNALICIDVDNVEQLEADARIASMLQLQYDKSRHGRHAVVCEAGNDTNTLSPSDWPKLVSEKDAALSKMLEQDGFSDWKTVNSKSKTRQSLTTQRPTTPTANPQLIEQEDDTPSTPITEHRKIVLVDWTKLQQRKDEKENKKTWNSVLKYSVAQNAVFDTSDDLSQDKGNEDANKSADTDDEEVSDDEDEHEQNECPDDFVFEYYFNMAKSILSKHSQARFNL